MALPDVTVLICTYNRPDELTKTIEGLRANLTYEGDVHYLICDDSSPDGYVAKLKKQKLFKDAKATFVSTPENRGWAANVNNGLSQIDTDFVFFIEDDYVLTVPLDLSLGVAIMLETPLGMLRYRGTAGDHLVYHQFEADVSKHLQSFYQGFGVEGKVSYLQIDSGSPSLYIYSHGPHLKRRNFHAFYGMYPEGLKLGQTEEAYAHTVKDGMKLPGAPGIAILPEWIPMHFDHIGKSYQHTEADK